MQYISLKGEIANITIDLENTETYHALMNNKEYHPAINSNPEIICKIFDVRKNLLDRLFGKLKTFSNSWLLVTGGVVSALFFEILRTNAIQPLSALTIVVCAVLLWCIAQNLYGRLNYALVRKTKDLAFGG
jgi:hypothetical protein